MAGPEMALPFLFPGKSPTLYRLSLFAPPAGRKCLIFCHRPQKVGTTESFSTERLQRQFEEVAA